MKSIQTNTQAAECGHKDFPLYRHATGQWAGKAGGKLRYFGSIRIDPSGQNAWARYKAEYEEWKAGRNPRQVQRRAGDGPVHLREIADRWLVYRGSLTTDSDPENRIDSRTYDSSVYTIKVLWLALKELQLSPKMDPLAWPQATWSQIRAKMGEIRLASSVRGVSPATKGDRIVNTHMMFTWAKDEAKLIATLPDWGRKFRTVGIKIKQEYRYDFQRKHGDRTFALAVARQLLDAADNAVARAGLNSNNSTGYRGVSQRKEDGKYEAYIVLKRNGAKVKHHLGEFKTPEEAGEAYRQAAAERGLNMEKRMVVGAHLFCACEYLAANTGAYSKDIGSLFFEDLELDRSYLERKRAKTGELWQAVLWPETIERIRAYLPLRPEPNRKHRLYHADWEQLVFLSSTGLPVNMDMEMYDERGVYGHTNRKDILKAHMSKVLLELKIKVKGVNFGAWRHTFESLASSAIGCTKEDLQRFDALNRTTARRIPGSRNSYVKLRPDQLKPITDIVRKQLWPQRVADEIDQDQRLRIGEATPEASIRETPEPVHYLRLVR